MLLSDFLSNMRFFNLSNPKSTHLFIIRHYETKLKMLVSYESTSFKLIY